MIATADTEHLADISMAKDIAETLHAHYPGHLWAVTIRGGVAVVKALNVSSLWGFILRLSNIQHDAGTRTREIMRAGGEILERAKLERKQRRLGETVKAVEGIKNYQPIGVR